MQLYAFILVIVVWDALPELLGVVLWFWGCLGKLYSLNCAVANLPNTNKNVL